MKPRARRWDTAEHLVDRDEERGFLEEMLKDCTPAELAAAIEAVAKARGMRAIAAEVGLSPAKLFQLTNPYDEAYDSAALRKLADKFVGPPAAKPADAAE